MEIVNQNPNLPLGITVGSYNNSDIFCLDSNDDDEDKKVCYNNIPGVHRLLSNFDLNDYKQREQKVDGEEEEVELLVLSPCKRSFCCTGFAYFSVFLVVILSLFKLHW